MIQEYKQHSVVDTFGDNAMVYEVSKNNKKYLMYEIDDYNDSYQYNFKVLKKVVSSKILAVVEEFQCDGNRYIVTDYASSDLLKQQISNPHKVFPLPVALDYFAKIIVGIEQLHESKLMYGSIRPEVIKVEKDNIFFYDFMQSQFYHKKRLFQKVGCLWFLAPQFFTEDGYGKEADIWACGVLLFFMLFHEYPFSFKEKNQASYLQEFQAKCGKGYNFSHAIKQCKNPGYIKSNKALEDFFYRIFQIDYSQRIRIKQIKRHKLFEGYFEEQKTQSNLLQQIGEEESLIMSKYLSLKDFKCAEELQKQQSVFFFVEKCAQNMMLYCSEEIPEQVRLKAQFSIVKVALIRINRLQNALFGKTKPDFKVDPDDWERMRGTTVFKKITQELSRQKKTFIAIFKAAKMQLNEKVAETQKEFYSEEIPESFDDIKIPFRNNLSSIFEITKSKFAKAKGNRELLRKLTQLLVRVSILHLINRIFQEQNIETDLAEYINWNKSRKLENLNAWVLNQKVSTLKKVIKQVCGRYL